MAGSPSEIFRRDVDLRDFGVGRVELAVRKIRAEHEKRVAIQHRVIAGAEADEPVMPTSNGLSYSTYSLPPKAWTIGDFSASGELQQRLDARRRSRGRRRASSSRLR